MKLRHALPATVLAVFPLLGISAPAAFGGENEPPGDKTTGNKKAPKDPPQKKEETAAECVKHTIEARYVAGYDHLVHLKNECSRRASCKVSTDVNPEVQNVTLAPGKSATVLTFRGSPASTFQATVACTLEG
jgi:hypothetical protein